MKKFALLILLFLPSIAWAQPQIQYETYFADSFKEGISEGVSLFEKKYGSIGPITIHADTVSQPEILRTSAGTDSLTNLPFAYTFPGHVFINKKLPRMTKKNLKYVMEHEPFHAIAPESATYLAIPDTLEDGTLLVGYHGLSMIFVEKSGRRAYSKIVEEAGAESVAASIDSQYQVSSYWYYRIGTLMNNFINQNWISNKDLVVWQKTNGYEDFCSKVLAKKRKNLTIFDLAFVANCFEGAVKSKDAYREIIESVAVKRYKNIRDGK